MNALEKRGIVEIKQNTGSDLKPFPELITRPQKEIKRAALYIQDSPQTNLIINCNQINAIVRPSPIQEKEKAAGQIFPVANVLHFE